MVINPILGVYMPIIRIPIKGGMTIPNIATFDPGTHMTLCRKFQNSHVIVHTHCSRQLSRINTPPSPYFHTIKPTLSPSASLSKLMSRSRCSNLGTQQKLRWRFLKMNHFPPFLGCFPNLGRHSMFFVKMNPDSHYLLWPNKTSSFAEFQGDGISHRHYELGN